MLSTYNRVENPKPPTGLEERVAVLEQAVKAQGETIDNLLLLVCGMPPKDAA